MTGHPTRRRLRSGLTVATLTVSAALALAGCASAGPQVATLDKQSAGPTATADSSKAFYDCLESTGLAVTKGAGGVPDFGNASADDIVKAQQKCASLAPAGSNLGGSMSGTSKVAGGGGAQSQKDYIAEMTKFARCMRAEGITDFADPDPNGGMSFTTPKDPPAFTAASKACEKKTGVKSGMSVSGG